VEYLGHTISHKGIKVDPYKIKAMVEWSIQKEIKNTRGFLGLVVYYLKFVKNYGRIETPLSTLLKKDAFYWNQEEIQYFDKLMEDMCKSLILTTPDFTKK
jgi:hypothetical protein